MADELISWDDKYLVGNSTIDTQHRELVMMTNDFYSGVQIGGVMAKVYFLQTIKGALNYVKTHFADEERMMQKAEYPHFDEHKGQHESFIGEVTRQVRDFEKSDNPDPAGFVRFLMNWILNHIAESDKKYSPYLEKIK